MRCLKSLLSTVGLVLALILLAGCCSPAGQRNLARLEATLDALLAARPGWARPVATVARATQTPRPVAVVATSTPVVMLPTPDLGGAGKPAAKGRSTSAGQPAPGAASLPKGWTLHEQRPDGFTIGLPASWQRIELDAADLSRAIDMIASDNEELRSLLGDQAQAALASRVCFFAVDLDPKSLGAGATNINIIRQGWVEGVPLAEAVASLVQQLESVPAVVKPVGHQPIVHPVGEAYEIRTRMKLTLSDGKELVVTLSQYVIVAGPDCYVISFATSPELAPQYVPVFRQILQTFRLLP